MALRAGNQAQALRRTARSAIKISSVKLRVHSVKLCV
jgi:hypothetical protein